MAFTPDFEIVHLGVNCPGEAEAAGCAQKFARLFNLAVNPAKESADARFTTTQIEWMKKPGRGTHGHIALATADLPAARRYLEEKGFAFDDVSAKYLPDGRVLVLYAKEEIGGFAIHLMQK
jgi:hypothetical protein